MSGHTHDMRPVTSIFKCTSCAFLCTARGLTFVNRLKGKHVRVKAGSPQSKVPWDGPAR